MAVNHIPDGYHSVTPYLSIDGAAEAIEFYKRAFGAEELLRFPMPDGKVAHAEIRIGDSHICLADDNEEGGLSSPRGNSPVGLLLYVKDVDNVFARAVEAGAKPRRPPADQFYGDRIGTLEDPFGHAWFLATHIEDLSMEELQRRAAQ